MNNFTTFTNFSTLNEAVKRINTTVLTIDNINTYLDAVKKRIPEQVANIIYLTAKYNLVSQKDIDDIRNANKGQLSKLAFKYNISIVEMEDLWEGLKKSQS